jgi:hypothetical protein
VRTGTQLLAMAVLLLNGFGTTSSAGLLGDEELVPDAPTPGFSVGTDNNFAGGPTCSRSEDDNGFGGTHVSCKYDCSKNAVLAIGVHAHDGDASAYGSTECGGASAPCDGHGGYTCLGASQGITEFREEKATCSGHSDEFWDSPVTVACSAIGADEEAVCRVVPELPPCEGYETEEPDRPSLLDDVENPCEHEICQDPVHAVCDGNQYCDPQTICVKGNPVLMSRGERLLDMLFAEIYSVTPVGFQPEDGNVVAAVVDGAMGLWVAFRDGICVGGLLTPE